MKSSSAASAPRCSASTVLYCCSQIQAAAPKECRPTMRELPLSVWNARRSVVRRPRSAGSARSSTSASSAPCSTSRASSRKTSRISSSPSRSPAPGAAASAAGASGSSPGASVAVWTNSTSASDSFSRASATACASSAAACNAAWALATVATSSGCSATCASRERRSRPRVTSISSTSSRAELSASVCACSISCGGASGAAAASAACAGRRPMTEPSVPLAASKRNSDFAICGCTLNMSIRKPSAPRLPASRSKVPPCAPRAGSTSVCSSASTSSLMRSAACDAWSRPSTDSTPRIACSCAGTGVSTWRSAGLRKYWSISFSDSESAARISCTTLPSVWRSETRR